MHLRLGLKVVHFVSIVSVNYYGLSKGTDIRDLYSDSHQGKEMRNIGHKMCIKECNSYNNQTCVSYRYDWDNFICFLQEENVESRDDNHLVEERSDLPGILSGLCSSALCNKKERCVVLHGGKTTCSIFACDEPPLVPNAIVDDGSVHVKSTRTFRCITGYIMFGFNDITCKARGIWTDVEFICYKDCTDDYTYVFELDLCYRVMTTVLAQHDAESQCNQNGTTLLKVDSYGKFEYFADMFLNPNESNGMQSFGLWVDGKYNNGRWEDGTGEEIEEIFWDPDAPVEPYNDTCMYFSYSDYGPWISNSECTGQFYYICQMG